MKKIFFTTFIMCLFILCQKPVFSSELAERHDIFTPAFQLVWQDFKELIATKKVNFKGIDPKVVKVLNSNKFSINDISDDSYYKVAAPKSLTLKAKIQREIFEKFSETSKVLDNIDWESKGRNDYILYSLFKKDVEFPSEFDVLGDASFNGSKEKYKFFGFKDNANRFKQQVKPLFYAYTWDYAVSLETKSGDRIILYRTDSKSNVYDLYAQLDKKTNKNLCLGDSDELIVPFISLNSQIEYNEIVNKKINGTKYIIAKAIDDIQFNMDNKGAKLRNESIIEAVEMSMPIPGRGTKYDFSKPFVLYMIEKDKSLPYFAIRINNPEFLVK